ncbi:Uma2 family endonuclease [Actinoplanes sp. NPDC000266]
MTAAPQWRADDLDRLPEAPRHIELIDGRLVFRTCPQHIRHSRLVTALLRYLAEQAPEGFDAELEMTIRLDERNSLEPDLLVTTAPYDPDRTYFTPDTVALVVEVVSPESAHRDRTIKPRKYARAGIANYWRVEDETGSPAVHTYELNEPMRSYAPTGIHRHHLRTATPFPIELDLDNLLPGHKG